MDLRMGEVVDEGEKCPVKDSVFAMMVMASMMGSSSCEMHFDSEFGDRMRLAIYGQYFVLMSLIKIGFKWDITVWMDNFLRHKSDDD